MASSKPNAAGHDAVAVVPAHSYRQTQKGIVWNRRTENGATSVPLTNFSAKIVADVTKDNGSQVERFFEIERIKEVVIIRSWYLQASSRL